MKYSSSNPKIARVDSKGKITAVKKGTAVITAKANTKKFNCKVTVKAAQKPKPTPTPVPKPSLSATTLNMNKGDVRQLQVGISPGMIFLPGSNSRQETMNIDRM